MRSPYKDPRFDFYIDEAGEHRWSLVAGNGKIIADSAEGFSSRRNAERNAERVATIAPKARRLGSARGGSAPRPRRLRGLR